MKKDIFKRLSKRFLIKRVTKQDRDGLIAFFQQAYSDQYNASQYKNTDLIVRKWNWYNLENPYISKCQIPSWMCLHKGRIVGHFATIPISLKFGGNSVQAAWGRDLIVAPKFRNYGVGPFLIHQVIQENRDLFVFLIAGLNDDVYTIYRKFDFADLGLIPLYVKILNFEKSLQLFLKSHFLRKAFIPFLKGMLLFKSSFRVGRKNGNFEFVKVHEFSEEENNFYRSTSVNFPALVERDETFLNWRYIRQPLFNYTVVKARSFGKMRGYIVLKVGQARGLKTGNIVDLFCHPSDAQAQCALINYAIRHFSAKGDIDIIKSNILYRDLATVLSRAGFLNIPSNSRFMMKLNNKDFSVFSAGNREDWFITSGDSDLDLS